MWVIKVKILYLFVSEHLFQVNGTRHHGLSVIYHSTLLRCHPVAQRNGCG